MPVGCNIGRSDSLLVFTPSCEASTGYVCEANCGTPLPYREIAVLSDLFQMATTEHRSTHSTFGRKNPSLRLIEMFLELGINPNQRLRTNPNRAHISDDTMTIYGNSLFLILPRDLNCSNSFSAMEPIHSCRSLLNLSCMRASMTLGRFWRRLG